MTVGKKKSKRPSIIYIKAKTGGFYFVWIVHHFSRRLCRFYSIYCLKEFYCTNFKQCTLLPVYNNCKTSNNIPKTPKIEFLSSIRLTRVFMLNLNLSVRDFPVVSFFEIAFALCIRYLENLLSCYMHPNQTQSSLRFFNETNFSILYKWAHFLSVER